MLQQRTPAPMLVKFLDMCPKTCIFSYVSKFLTCVLTCVRSDSPDAPAPPPPPAALDTLPDFTEPADSHKSDIAAILSPSTTSVDGMSVSTESALDANTDADSPASGSGSTVANLATIDIAAINPPPDAGQFFC